MRVLVTGANGFIGSHLSEALVQAGHEVVAGLRRSSNPRWLKDIQLKIFYWDGLSTDELSNYLNDIDVVFHLAGKTKAAYSRDYENTNVHFTRYLINLCAHLKNPPKKWIHLSSLAAGGPSMEDHPLTENSPSNPVSAYGETKLTGEHVLKENDPPFPVTILRPPAVFGPRDTEFFEILHRLSRGLFITIGQKKRMFSYIYVKDLVEGMLTAATTSKTDNQTYYLCNPDPVDWKSFRDTAANILNTDVKTVSIPEWLLFLAALEGNVRGWITSKPSLINSVRVKEFREPYWTCRADKAKEAFNFQTTYTLEAALKETISWYQEVKWID